MRKRAHDMRSRMRESASTDLREPQGSNPLGPPGPELAESRDRLLLQDDGRRLLLGFDFIPMCPVVVDPRPLPLRELLAIGHPFPVPPAVLRGQAVAGPWLVLLMSVITNEEILEQDFLTVPGRQPVDPLVSYTTVPLNPGGQ